MKKLLMVLLLNVFAFNINSQITGWSQKPSLSAGARARPYYFQINDKFYVGGGGDNGGIVTYKDLWEFDPTTDAWTQKLDFPFGNVQFTSSFALNGKGYVLCPTTSTSTSKEVWQYNPTSNAWVQKNNFPMFNPDFTFIANGVAYVGVPTGTTTALYQYNETGDSWTQKTDLPGLAKFQSFSLGGKGYCLIAPTTSIGSTSKLFEYNTVTDIWTQKATPSFTVARAYANIVASSDYAYMVGGQVPAGGSDYYTNFTFKYDPITDTWTRILNSSLYETMWGALFMSNNKLYYTCGFYVTGTTNVTNQMWASTFPVGVKENESDVFRLYPNPVKDRLTLELKSEQNVSVSDILGNEVIKINRVIGKQEIQMEHLDKGIYILRVGGFSKKIIKE